jgi:hypothetical protein
MTVQTRLHPNAEQLKEYAAVSDDRERFSATAIRPCDHQRPGHRFAD